MITKEMIKDRITLLEREFDQVKANLLAYDGALQEARHWLSILDKEESNDRPA